MASYLVVGGSSGMGLAVVQKLTAAGHQVWVASRTESNELAQTGATCIPWDATGSDVLTDLPEALDGLAYCPGSINLKPFHRLKLEEFQADLDINYMGAIKAIQAALPALKKQGGSVVLYSTVAVNTGMPFHSAIAGAKGAVEGLTLALAAEYAGAGLRFNAIAPSLTDTPLAGRLLATPEKQEAAAKRHPLGRVGTPQDMASLTAFLLSPEAAWITGQIIGVDGGMGSLRA